MISALPTEWKRVWKKALLKTKKYASNCLTDWRENQNPPGSCINTIISKKGPKTNNYDKKVEKGL